METQQHQSRRPCLRRSGPDYEPSILTVDTLGQAIEECFAIDQRLNCLAALCDSTSTVCVTGMDLALILRDIRNRVGIVLEGLDILDSIETENDPEDDPEDEIDAE